MVSWVCALVYEMGNLQGTKNEVDKMVTAMLKVFRSRSLRGG